jgi:hypothetical protein
MPFDSEAFSAAALRQRTKDVPVPELAAWFPDGEQPVWRVRAVGASDFARANQAAESRKRGEAFLEALAGGVHAEMVRELQALVGRDRTTIEPDIARRIELVIAGSLDPICDEGMAVRLAEHFPVVLYSLSNAILTITGQGSDVEKKPGRSGGTRRSAAPSPSPTDSGECSTSSGPT